MKIKIIFGPPGTGKTTRLISIVDKELDSGVHPDEIAYCSFTKEGSNQGKYRAIAKFGCKEESLPYFRTLHSLAFQALGMNRDLVMSRHDYKKFSEKVGMSFVGYYTADLTNNDDKYLFYNDIYRNNTHAAAAYLKDLDTDKLMYVMKSYKAYKETFAKYDFTDMIQRFISSKLSLPVKVAIIDEAQDLTSLQWKMVWSAFRDCERIYIAGDDDQAIYQWSGADVDHFLGIKGEVEILNKSWRLPDKILKYSSRLAREISKRVDKKFDSRGAEGEVIHVNSSSEIPIIPEESYMFLSRNNAFLDGISDELMQRDLVFSVKGVPSLSRDDVKVINLYEKVRKERIMTPADAKALQWYLPRQYSLDSPWYDVFKWSSIKIDYVRNLIANKTSVHDPKVLVSTIHSVKGGEADNVAVFSGVTGSVYENINRNPDSEHRVFYVGCTRAKKRLYIVHQDSRYVYPML